MTRYALPTSMFFKQIDSLLIKMMGILLLIMTISEFSVMLLFSWLNLEEILSPIIFALVDALTLISIAAGPMYIWIIQPVKKAIVASQHRHNILSSAVKNAGDGIMISNREGKIEYVNQAFRDILQCENEDVIDQSITMIDPIMATASWKRRFMHAIRYEQVWHDEQWGTRKNGEKYLAKVTVTPILNHKSKNISNFITIMHDHTSHHELEIQYHQAQKMEAVGTLVGGIAHDFNNMLSALIGHLYIAKKQLNDTPANEKLLHRLEKMEALETGAAEMIRQLMAFARKTDVEKFPLTLTSFMKEALKLAEVSLPANIDFQSDIVHGKLNVCANATQLQQVLMNLINNARDAVTDITRPQIRVSMKSVNANHASLHRFPAPAQTYVEICVSDNGCGISAENITKIMEPFFTTKAVGKGTGLGLSMVYGIVQDHHGYIDIISSLGEGASIHIFLPTVNSDCCPLQQTTSGYQGQGETILLVDDQQNVRETSRDILESLGYVVLEACDGVEALEVYFKHTGVIAAALIDVVMPRMQGVEVAARIKQYNPALPIILTSGYDRDDVLGDFDDSIVDLILNKPVAINVLSQNLHQMLGAPKTKHGQMEIFEKCNLP